MCNCVRTNFYDKKMYIDIFLFTTILLLCLVNAHISYFSGPILKWLNRLSSQERNLLDQKLKLQKDQSQINMIDNFAKHAKLQRRINAIDEQLAELKTNRQSNNLITRLFLQYGMKLPIGIVLLFIVIYYRNSPVVILNKQLDLFPFSSLISYPLKEVNSVSVHVWAICCSGATKLIKT